MTHSSDEKLLSEFGEWLFQRALATESVDGIEPVGRIAWEVSGLIQGVGALHDLFIDVGLYCEHRVAEQRGESHNVVGTRKAVEDDLMVVKKENGLEDL